MVGNLWEWTAEWFVAGRTTHTTPYPDAQAETPWPDYGDGDDATWNLDGRAYDGSQWINGLPAAALRGGSWSLGTSAGVFAVYLNYSPSHRTGSIGFRCARRL